MSFKEGDLVYLAGPMSGIEKFNFPAFFEFQALLENNGLKVVSPAQHDIEEGVDINHPEQQTQGFREKMLAWDFGQIVGPVVGVVLLPGWRTSVGARAECMLAQMIGKPAMEFVIDSNGTVRGLASVEAVHTYAGDGAGPRPS